jgi:glycosyltransferase involved in cell wall biosynthesis
VRRIVNYLSYLLSAVWCSLWLPRPDVVIATSPQFFCGWAGVWASRFKKCPFVLEIRDIWPESIQAVGAMQGGPVLRYMEWLERRMYEAADHIVAVGGGYRDRIIAKAAVEDRISVIMNGVDTDKFDTGTAGGGAAQRHRWGLHDRFVCSYVGTIGMAHGLDVVLDAADTFRRAGRRDVAFLMVGDGARRAELEAAVKQRGLSDWIVFTGRQPREMMPAVLAASDACLVHLRATELFSTVIPSKIFEAMAMARPIIMGVTGEAREIVIGAGAGIAMEPESGASLVAAIETLADNADVARTMGELGQTYVMLHGTREQLARRFLSLLSELTGAERFAESIVSPAHEPVIAPLGRATLSAQGARTAAVTSEPRGR